MTLLDRYIAVEIAKAFVLVMLALVFVFSFLDLIKQLDDVGSGSFGFSDALLFEVRMLAPRALNLLPFGALMGTTIALSLLAHRGEIIAAQAAGVSVLRIAWSVLKSAILVLLVVVLLDEFLISKLHQEAARQRSLSLSGSLVTRVDGGFWIFQGNRLIHINRVQHGRVPVDIDILEMDETRRVNLFIHAQQADVSDPNRWLLKDVLVKRLRGPTLDSERISSMHWESYMTTDQIGLLELPPPTLSPTQLYDYVRYLRGTGQETSRYDLTLWQKLTLPIAVVVMVLLAIPAAFGTPRSTSVERRVIAALAAGLLFQIATQVIANAGLVLQLPPALTTLVTPVATTAVALVLLRRVRS